MANFSLFFKSLITFFLETINNLTTHKKYQIITVDPRPTLQILETEIILTKNKPKAYIKVCIKHLHIKTWHFMQRDAITNELSPLINSNHDTNLKNIKPN